jgi:dihydroorotase
MLAMLIRLGTSDGIAYDCDIYIDKHKVCHVNNAGMGGNTLVAYYTPKTQVIFDKFVAENNLKDFIFTNGYDFMKVPSKINDEVILSELVEDAIQDDENRKIIRKYHYYTTNR